MTLLGTTYKKALGCDSKLKRLFNERF